MAAILSKRGHSVIADDVMGTDISGAFPKILPAFPQLKLWPDALDSLGVNLDLIPKLTQVSEKRAHEIAESFTNHALPLSRIYLLGKGPTLDIKQLPEKTAMMHLLRNVYTRRFSHEVTQTTQVNDFLACSTIAKTVPSFILTRPTNLDMLQYVAEEVEGHTAPAGK